MLLVQTQQGMTCRGYCGLLNGKVACSQIVVGIRSHKKFPPEFCQHSSQSRICKLSYQLALSRIPLLRIKIIFLFMFQRSYFSVAIKFALLKPETVDECSVWNKAFIWRRLSWTLFCFDQCGNLSNPSNHSGIELALLINFFLQMLLTKKQNPFCNTLRHGSQCFWLLFTIVMCYISLISCSVF